MCVVNKAVILCVVQKAVIYVCGTEGCYLCV